MSAVVESACVDCREPKPETSLSSLGRCWHCIIKANPHEGGFPLGHRVTEEELEVLAKEHRAKKVAARNLFIREVEAKAYDLRVLEAARAKVAADADRDTLEALDAQYLSRDDLDDLPEAESLIEGILPRHSYGVLRGRDHSFKTFVALDWALCVAMGKAWQGHLAPSENVLYIAGEGAHGIRERVKAWESAWQMKVPAGQLTVRKSALNLYRPGLAFNHLLERVEWDGYGLVVVDTLRRVSGGADGNGSDMGAVVDNLDRIKQATSNGSVLVISHTDKGDNDSRGYSGIEDDADFVWHAKRDEMRVELKLTKMKDGPDGNVIHLQARPVLDSLVLAGTTAASATTVASQARIIEEIRSTFPDGASNTQLRAATGLPESTYYRAIGELRRAGHLVNTGTKNRPFLELGGSTGGSTDSHDSHALPPKEQSSDLHVSHDSHVLPLNQPTTPTTPTPLGSGSESESESETKPLLVGEPLTDEVAG